SPFSSLFYVSGLHRALPSFPTRRSSDLGCWSFVGSPGALRLVTERAVHGLTVRLRDGGPSPCGRPNGHSPMLASAPPASLRRRAGPTRRVRRPLRGARPRPL